MNWSGRREKFRSLLETDKCYYPASVFDPMSARIAEDLGFEVGMLAGSVASLTVLGAPDLILLTLSEFSQQVYRINRACDLPVLVDADHGYGNALNVKRTVEELESAGVAALTIEDTDLPQPYATLGSSRLLSLDEGIGKMKAALAGRSDPNLVVTARTSAMALHGLDETIKRVEAYAALGVDALFLVGIETKEQLDAITQCVDLPLILGSSPDALKDPEFLARQRVRICNLGHQPIMAAVQAVYTTMEALREGQLPGTLSGVASKSLMQKVTRDNDYQQWMSEFLGGG